MPSLSSELASVPMVTLADPAVRPAAGALRQDSYDLDTPWHAHDMHQLQYAFEGAIEVEDQRGSYFLPRTLAAWIPAGLAHRTSLHRIRSGSILFSPDMVPHAGDRVRIIEVSPLMREMVLEAMRWPLKDSQDAMGEAYFASLAHLCGEWIQREAALHLPTAKDLQAALEYTRANLKSGDVIGASRAAGLSERTLRRRFRTRLGMTWEAYQRRARLLSAATLLTETSSPIGHVAAEVGFESQSAFARAFKNLLGRTPREFRTRSGSPNERLPLVGGADATPLPPGRSQAP
ncbi:MAG: helix-turn-helix transcriptional regulator [Myxococcales bacterium]|nr:helix-turn-helix transcriptional regulator [Myxococcales bacterium]